MSSEPIGTVLGGRYRLQRVLGSGAMGTVYEAVDGAGERFAIKLLLKVGATHAEAARFAREVRLTSALSHPNVTTVLDSGVDRVRGAAYLVMELLSGEDLESLLRRRRPLAPELAVRIALQACRGVEAAHAAGIIHRDIKPSNVFLCRGSHDELHVKVCDFGLAKQLFGDDSLTSSRSILGSPSYMSPEQAKGSKAVDGRTDVWSLGMTLYEMLAGATAFEGAESLASLLAMLESGPIPPLQDRAPWVSPECALVAHGTLLRDLDARCPNIGALMDALRPLAGGAERIDSSMLLGLSEDLRSTQAPRAELPQSWHEVEARVRSFPPPREPESMTVRLLGHVLGDRYPLLGVIGHGGMGAVYETRGLSGERLAVKVIRKGADRRPDALRRFVREARATMSISNPHVVRVVDAGTDSTKKVPFIVMELLIGQDLASVLRNAGALEVGPAARIFTQACAGLAAAHAIGVVHRDIKPANLFLHELPSGEFVAKICDFGVAKRVLSDDSGESTVDLTRTGGVLGSPMYFSPEQAKNAKNVDPRTDIFSLAVSLYEAVSGRRPWEACSTVGEVILAVCTQDVPPLHEVAPWVSSEFAAVVHKGLRRDPSERYASMQEFAATLEPFAIAGELRRATLSVVPDEKRAMVAAPRGNTTGSTTALATTALANTMKDVAPAGAPARSARGRLLGGALVVAVLGASVFALSERRPGSVSFAAGARSPAASAAPQSAMVVPLPPLASQAPAPPSIVASATLPATSAPTSLSARAAPSAVPWTPRAVGPRVNRPPSASAPPSSASTPPVSTTGFAPSRTE